MPVEIVNHTDPWAQWLPPMITVLVGLIALGGVIWSNKAAAMQEHRKWRLETILRLGTEAYDASIAARGELSKIAHSDVAIEQDLFEPFRKANRQIRTVGTSLRLLGAEDAAESCGGLYTHLAPRTSEMQRSTSTPPIGKTRTQPTPI